MTDTNDHPQREAIDYLSALILRTDPEITEQVKWNAPSFCYDGVDRITFQLKSTEIQLIFHRGAKVRADTESFEFKDDSGLMQWRSPDRAIVTFKDLADVKAHEDPFTALVKRWIAA